MTDGLDAIISGAVERAEAAETASVSDSSADTGGDEAVVETADAPAEDTAGETAPAAVATEADSDPDVPDLSATELAGPTIPVHRHKAVLTKARKQAEAIQKKLEALAWAESQDTRDKLRAIEVADQNPEVFLRVLSEDPRFQPLLQQMFGAAPVAEKPATAHGQSTDAVSDRPQPDVLFPDGSVGFSAQATEKLLAWQTQEFERKFQKSLEDRVGALTGEIKPVLEKHRGQVLFQEAVSRQRVVVENARQKWPGFAQHEAAVRDHLLRPGNENVSLEEAYREVVVPKMQSDREQIRKEVMAEMGTQKAKAANPGPKATGAAPEGKRTLDQIIAAASGLALAAEE